MADMSLKDIPLIGDSLYDFRQEVHGNPDANKANYDKLIQESKDAQTRQMEFLMGQKGEAQKLYAPMQQMFQRMYGTAGINAPQTPQAPQAGPGRVETMYGAR